MTRKTRRGWKRLPRRVISLIERACGTSKLQSFIPERVFLAVAGFLEGLSLYYLCHLKPFKIARCQEEAAFAVRCIIYITRDPVNSDAFVANCKIKLRSKLFNGNRRIQTDEQMEMYSLPNAQLEVEPKVMLACPERSDPDPKSRCPSDVPSKIIPKSCSVITSKNPVYIMFFFLPGLPEPVNAEGGRLHQRIAGHAFAFPSLEKDLTFVNHQSPLGEGSPDVFRPVEF